MIADRAQLNADALQPLAVNGQDAARLVGLSGRSWRRLDAQGLVPQALRVGGSKRWNVAELRGWIEAGCPSRARWAAMARVIA